MHYFDDDDTRPLLVDDESESENMTSYVIVVNNCKRGHDAIDITLKKQKPMVCPTQSIDQFESETRLSIGVFIELHS